MTGQITPESLKALRLQLDPNDDEAEQAMRMAIERIANRDIRTALREMIDTLYPQGYGEWLDPQLEAARIHREFLTNQKLKDAVARALQDSVDLGISVAVDQLAGVGIGFDYTLAHVAARDWALAHTDEILGQLAANTERGVGQAVARWVENGEPLDALIRDLEVFFSPKRASMIAATEVTRAYAEGSAQAFNESGVVKLMEWRTANDEIVCPICGALNGKRRKYGEPFDAAIPLPPAHPNCRCWIVPVV